MAGTMHGATLKKPFAGNSVAGLRSAPSFGSRCESSNNLAKPRTPRSPEVRLGTRCRSSIPGVFAVGDVRSRSVKRVGGAIGEGAAVVALIHQHLALAA